MTTVVVTRPTLTATASSSYGGAENPGSALDGDPSTRWDNGGSLPSWWQIALSAAATVTTYSIRRRDDAQTRNPATWVFQGSQDGSSWDDLDTQTGITWPTTGQTQTFTFTNTTAYLYYRIYITANGGASQTSLADVLFPNMGIALLVTGLAETAFGACDLTLTGGPVVIDWTLWISQFWAGVAKQATLRLRRTNLTGSVLASSVIGDSGDSGGGHQASWISTYTDSAPTDGHYVMTVQETAGNSTTQIYTNAYLFSLTATATAAVVRRAIIVASRAAQRASRW